MSRSLSASASAVEISIIVPVHDEAQSLGAFWERLRALQMSQSREVIFVDDGSTDETWNRLARLATDAGGVSAIRLSRNFGKEAAIMAGLGRSRGAAVVVIDGDLQHPPELIPEMIAAWRDRGVDIVEASKRRDSSLSPLSRLYSEAFYALFRRVAGAELRGASDFKLLDRSVVDVLCAMPERSVFFRGLAGWVGFHRRETLHFDVAPRSGGESSWSFTRRARLATDAITSFSALPLRIVSLGGLAFSVFGAVLGADTLYRKLTGMAVDGFTTVILLLITVGGLIMLGLGVIGEYLARIYEEVKGRPRHVVEEVIGPAATGGTMRAVSLEERIGK